MRKRGAFGGGGMGVSQSGQAGERSRSRLGIPFPFTSCVGAVWPLIGSGSSVGCPITQDARDASWTTPWLAFAAANVEVVNRNLKLILPDDAGQRHLSAR